MQTPGSIRRLPRRAIDVAPRYEGLDWEFIHRWLAGIAGAGTLALAAFAGMGRMMFEKVDAQQFWGDIGLGFTTILLCIPLMFTICFLSFLTSKKQAAALLLLVTFGPLGFLLFVTGMRYVFIFGRMVRLESLI